MKTKIKYLIILIITICLHSCCDDDIVFYSVNEVLIGNFNIETEENADSVTQQEYALRAIVQYDISEVDNGVWCKADEESTNDVVSLNLTADNSINGISPGESLNEIFNLKFNNSVFDDFSIFLSEANSLEFNVFFFIFDESLTIDPVTTSFTFELTLADNSTISATTDLVTIN
jgi:hypothetical protein